MTTYYIQTIPSIHYYHDADWFDGITDDPDTIIGGEDLPYSPAPIEDVMDFLNSVEGACIYCMQKTTKGSIHSLLFPHLAGWRSVTVHPSSPVQWRETLTPATMAAMITHHTDSRLLLIRAMENILSDR